MNLNKLAIEIAKREGGKKSISIAQIKEVLRHFADVLMLSDDDPFKTVDYMIFRAEKRYFKPKTNK